VVSRQRNSQNVVSRQRISQNVISRQTHPLSPLQMRPWRRQHTYTHKVWTHAKQFHLWGLHLARNWDACPLKYHRTERMQCTLHAPGPLAAPPPKIALGTVVEVHAPLQYHRTERMQCTLHAPGPLAAPPPKTALGTVVEVHAPLQYHCTERMHCTLHAPGPLAAPPPKTALGTGWGARPHPDSGAAAAGRWAWPCFVQSACTIMNDVAHSYPIVYFTLWPCTLQHNWKRVDL
jgi:hypothetical protein